MGSNMFLAHRIASLHYKAKATRRTHTHTQTHGHTSRDTGTQMLKHTRVSTSSLSNVCAPRSARVFNIFQAHRIASRQYETRATQQTPRHTSTQAETLAHKRSSTQVFQLQVEATSVHLGLLWSHVIQSLPLREPETNFKK
jgi:hypothetical protein